MRNAKAKANAHANAKAKANANANAKANANANANAKVKAKANANAKVKAKANAKANANGAGCSAAGLQIWSADLVCRSSPGPRTCSTSWKRTAATTGPKFSSSMASHALVRVRG